MAEEWLLVMMIGWSKREMFSCWVMVTGNATGIVTGDVACNEQNMYKIWTGCRMLARLTELFRMYMFHMND